MNTFKQYALALSCLALTGALQATHAPDTGFVKNELSKVIVVQPEYKDGGKGKQITVIKGRKEKLEKFDEIEALHVKIGNSRKFNRLTQCSYPGQHGTVQVKDNDHYNTFIVNSVKLGNPDVPHLKATNTEPSEFKDLDAITEGYIVNKLTKVIVVVPEYKDGGKGNKITVINGKTERLEKFNEIKFLNVKVGNSNKFIRLTQCMQPKHHGSLEIEHNKHFNAYFIQAVKSGNADQPTVACANIRVNDQDQE